jgi:hypothetical protein
LFFLSCFSCLLFILHNKSLMRYFPTSRNLIPMFRDDIKFFLKFKSAGLKNVLAGYFSINHANRQQINSINKVSLKKTLSNFPN